MDKLVITGGKILKGKTIVSGAKNVALKVLVAACLTDEEVIIENVPHISDVFVMSEIIEELGGTVEVIDHTLKVRMAKFAHTSIPLDKAALAKTSSMFLAPLLARMHEATVPNPGGCRLGARPIDRHIEGVKQMNVDITYASDDGYYHARTDGLTGTEYTFEKNTHTGTETLILAGVMAKGKTILRNAAEEPEIDELIDLLNRMGGNVKRTEHRVIEIEGVEKLHGATIRIRPDRNEVITFAIGALVTKGDILVKEATSDVIKEFIEKVEEAGGGVEETDEGIRFFYKGPLKATDVTTLPYPGFMTDWQAPWAVLMTQAEGVSTVHETIFENKMGYIKDLKKMGAHAELFNPDVTDKEATYNFNLEDDHPEYFHAARITGPTPLHNGVVTMLDIRAGAAVVLAALAAKGTSTIFGVEKLDRGYETFEDRMNALGADIQRLKEV